MKKIASILALLSLLCTISIIGAEQELTELIPTDSLKESRAVRLTLDGVVAQKIKGDLATAKELYLQAVNSDPLYSPPLYYLSNIYSSQSADTALYYAQRAYLLDSTNSWYARRYALLLLNTGSADMSMKLYDKLIEGDDADVDVYRQKAVAHRHSGDFEGAIEVLDSARSRFGFDPSTSLMQLEIYANNIKDYEKSQDIAQNIIQLWGEDIELRLAIASLYMSNGLDSLAKAEIERAQSLDTMNIQPKMMLIEWYDAKGDYPALFKVAREVVESDNLSVEYKAGLFESFIADRNFYSKFYMEINSVALSLWHKHPTSPVVLDIYTKHLAAGGMLDVISNIYSDLVYDNPTPEYDHIETLIDVEFFLKRPESVEKGVRYALSLYPDSLNLYPRVGNAYQFAGELPKAIDKLKWAIRNTKSDPVIQSTLWGAVGDCYQNIAQSSQGKARSSSAKQSFSAYEKSLKADKNNHLTLNNYAYALTQFNPSPESISKALVMSTRSNSIVENNASYIDTQGHILYLVGNYQQAKSTLQQAMALDSTNSEILLHYAEVLVALGEYFLADVYFDRAAAAGYPQEIIEEKKSEMERLKKEIK
ncbi:MAG: tetratricopeptide repeat protein [Rikenellaceae bacterium]